MSLANFASCLYTYACVCVHQVCLSACQRKHIPRMQHKCSFTNSQTIYVQLCVFPYKFVATHTIAHTHTLQFVYIPTLTWRLANIASAIHHSQLRVKQQQFCDFYAEQKVCGTHRRTCHCMPVCACETTVACTDYVRFYNKDI